MRIYTCIDCGVSEEKIKPLGPLPKRCAACRYALKKAVWTERNRAKHSGYEEGKLMCALCGKWYHKIISHVWQLHHVSGKQYRTMFNLPLSHGVLSLQARGNIVKPTAEVLRQLPIRGVRTRIKKGERKPFAGGGKGFKQPKDSDIFINHKN